MGLNPFKREKSLTELQETDDRLSTEASIARKRAMIRELEARAGKGSWKIHSANGKKSGISWSSVMNWLKHH